MYNMVYMVLSEEPEVLSDSVHESCHWGCLSASSSSSVTGGVVPVVVLWVCQVSLGVTQTLGRGLRVDRCQRMSLTEGDAFAVGVGFKVFDRWGM